MFKKIFSTFIALLVLLLIGCGGRGNDTNNEQSQGNENVTSQEGNNQTDDDESPTDEDNNSEERQEGETEQVPEGDAEDNQEAAPDNNATTPEDDQEPTTTNNATNPNDAVFLVQERMSDDMEVEHIAGGDVEIEGRYFFRIVASNANTTEVFFVEKGTGQIYYSSFDENDNLVPDI